MPLRASSRQLRAPHGAFAVACALFAASHLQTLASADEPVFPGKDWDRRSPAEVGLDAAKLDTFSTQVGGRGCVVRHGYLVHTWGDAARRGDVASACKPCFTHFLLLAIEQGKLNGVDDRVVEFEPRLGGLNAGLDFKDRTIRWRHLACQTSCYGVGERPGEAFDYSDFNMALFFDTLFLKVYGATWENVDDTVLRPLLTAPLECQDEPTFMAFGVKGRPGRLGVSPRDFARFGLLYLRLGRWKDRQLIAAEHIKLATTSPHASNLPRTTAVKAEMIAGQRSIGGGNNQTDHLGSYSFAWWTNGVDRDGHRHWPGVPDDAYGAFGHSGLRALVVIPSLDIVVSWNDSKIETREAEGAALKKLSECMVK